MLLISGPYPDASNARNGMVRRVAAIDAVLADVERVYLTLRHGPPGTFPPAALAEVAPFTRKVELNPFEPADAQLLLALAQQARCVLAHSVYFAQHVLPLYRALPAITDLHGAVPEELLMLGRSAEESALYRQVEARVLAEGAFGITVTDAMAAHFRAVHAVRAELFTLPVAGGAVPDDVLHKPRTLRAIYSGGTDVWQRVEVMAQALAAQPQLPVELLSPNVETLQAVLAQAGVQAQVRSLPPDEVLGRYAHCHFGFVLREAHLVNAVASPTKLQEYLAHGVVPIIESPQIGDFEALGYRYVTLAQLRAGALPDFEGWQALAEHNLGVARAEAARAAAGGRRLREVVALAFEGRLEARPPAAQPVPSPERATARLWESVRAAVAVPGAALPSLAGAAARSTLESPAPMTAGASALPLGRLEPRAALLEQTLLAPHLAGAFAHQAALLEQAAAQRVAQAQREALEERQRAEERHRATLASARAQAARDQEAALDALELELEHLRHATRAAQGAARHTQAQLAAAQAHGQWMEHSLSWKWTAPLRRGNQARRRVLAEVTQRLTAPAVAPRPPEGHDRALAELLAAHPGRPVVFTRPMLDWDWPMQQRPHHLAQALGRRGFLSFFCTPNGRDRVDGFVRLSEGCYLTNQFARVQAIARPKVLHVYCTDAGCELEGLAQARAAGARVLYDVIDALHPDVAGQPISQAVWERHRALLTDAEVVIASARALLAEVRAVRTGPCALVGNGVDLAHFSAPRAPRPPAALEAVVARGQPVVGYFGALARWFDYGLMKRLALERPGLQVVLLGQDYDGSLATSGLAGLPNVTVYGPVPYAELPQHAAWFDVATVPFLLNAITASTSPLKLFEALALGKAVVTTDLRECRQSRTARVARDAEGFLAAIDAAVAERGDPAVAARARAEAQEHRWEEKANVIATLLEEALARR